MELEPSVAFLNGHFGSEACLPDIFKNDRKRHAILTEIYPSAMQKSSTVVGVSEVQFASTATRNSISRLRVSQHVGWQLKCKQHSRAISMRQMRHNELLDVKQYLAVVSRLVCYHTLVKLFRHI